MFLLKSKNAVLTFLFVTIAFVACKPAQQPVSDEQLSYRNNNLEQPGQIPLTEFNAQEAGESTKLTRSFENAPPMIPHSVEDLLPIKADDNQCLECHAPENAADAEAPQTPASHLYDLRSGKQLSTVNAANFYCTLCHAPQIQQAELVQNTFVPEYSSPQAEHKSNLLDVINEGVK